MLWTSTTDSWLLSLFLSFFHINVHNVPLNTLNNETSQLSLYCTSVHFSRAENFTLALDRGASSGMIWSDTVTCTGSEASLDNCIDMYPAKYTTVYCSHASDVFLICSNITGRLQFIFRMVLLYMLVKFNSKHSQILLKILVILTY